MGNYQTKLPINRFFISPIKTIPVLEGECISLRIHLDPPAINNKEEKIKQVILCFRSDERLSIIHDETIEIQDNFTPKSHMKDFEIIHPFIKINRGQGIGVVIIEQIPAYVKLIYDKTKDHGVSPAVFTTWNHSFNARNLLNNDLSLGYNIFLVTSNGETNNLIEEIDDHPISMSYETHTSQ